MEWTLVGIILLYLGWDKLGSRRQRSTLSWFWTIIILGACLATIYNLLSGHYVGFGIPECPNPYQC